MIKRAVSMYSLQDEYLNKRMDLEDIFKFLSEQDVGIELLSDQMIKGAPFSNEKTLAKWDELVEKYKIPLVCNDIFINVKLYNNRIITVKEGVQMLINEIKFAHRLGFKLVRLVSDTPVEYIEPVLPYCEKYDVALGLEIHSGMSFNTPITKKYTDLMFKLKSKYVGIVVDAGIFCRRLPRVFNNYFLSIGANAELVATLDSIVNKDLDLREYLLQKGVDKNQILMGKASYPEEIQSKIKNGTDFEYTILADGYECTPFEALDEYMPYVKHIHGKIYEITDEGFEYSIPYDEFVKYLDKNGYDGYIATEYEGNRFTIAGKPMMEKEQVVRHQKLLRKSIDELKG